MYHCHEVTDCSVLQAADSMQAQAGQGDTSQAADVASNATPGLAGANGKMDIWTQVKSSF